MDVTLFIETEECSVDAKARKLSVAAPLQITESDVLLSKFEIY